MKILSLMAHPLIGQSQQSVSCIIMGTQKESYESIGMQVPVPRRHAIDFHFHTDDASMFV